MYIGAFDIGGTKTIIALADHTGHIYEKEQFTTELTDCFKHLDKCVRIFQDFLKRRLLNQTDIEGIGVNLPGIVSDGVLIRAVYSGWNQIPVRDYLIEKMGITNIFCENDVNACAIGEIEFGLGKTYQSFAWFTVSTGVGGALVDNGQLIRGSNGYAGEFGHLKVEYEHPQACPCGDMGCLEAHGSGTAISREIANKYEADEKFRLAFSEIEEEPSGASCAKLARMGNKIALDIYRHAGEYLGRAIAYYTNILNPQVIILGGGVMRSFDLLEATILESIRKNTFIQMKDIKVITTPLGYEAALMGAVALVLQNSRKKG